VKRGTKYYIRKQREGPSETRQKVLRKKGKAKRKGSRKYYIIKGRPKGKEAERIT
jgi:hypothetical protein